MNKVKREQAKPCPFCTSDDVGTATDIARGEHYCKEYWFAYCSDCGSRGPMADTEEEAVRYWNDRGEENG